jgi:hypothetical protein
MRGALHEGGGAHLCKGRKLLKVALDGPDGDLPVLQLLLLVNNLRERARMFSVFVSSSGEGDVMFGYAGNEAPGSVLMDLDGV